MCVNKPDEKKALEVAIKTLKDLHESYGTLDVYMKTRGIDLRAVNALEEIEKLLK